MSRARREKVDIAKLVSINPCTGYADGAQWEGSHHPGLATYPESRARNPAFASNPPGRLRSQHVAKVNCVMIVNLNATGKRN